MTTEGGQPVVAASVVITDLAIGVNVDNNGGYTLTVPAARVSGQTTTIRTRAIGYKPQTRTITLTSGTQTIDFALERDPVLLDAIVTTGVAAATEQVKVPFAVARLDDKQMPVQGASVANQIQGKVPGALIVSGTGRPGAAPQVVLRGPVSLNATGRSQGPLYLVDGIPVQGSVPDFNPSDIESVEVLKGAAAASLYGARAGSGVIAITTKTGRTAQEGLRFSFRTELGAGDIPRDFPLAQRTTLALDPTGQYFCTRERVGGSPCGRYINWDSEVNRINNSGESYSLPPQLFLRDFGISSAPSYDELTGVFQVSQWPRMRDPVAGVVTPSAYANSNVDLRGRFGSTAVFASVANSVQQGAVEFLGGYVRNSLRLNVDQQWGDKLSGSLKSFYAQTREDGAHLDETGSGGPWFNITRAPWMSDVLARDDQGRLIVRHNPLAQGDQNGNPLYPVLYDTRIDRGSRFVGGASARYSPFEWLNVDGSFGYDRGTSTYSRIRDRGWRTTSSNPTAALGIVRDGSGDNEQYNVQATATATHRFFSDLNATLSTRYVYIDETRRGQDFGGDALVVADLHTADAATTNYFISTGAQTIREAGYYVSGILDWKDRYNLDAVVRRDGSSLFGAGNRWQTFGRVAGSWIVSREPWWFAPDALSLVKLRASRGSTGQRPRFIAQYETFTIGTGGTLSPNQLGNRNLKPEISTETEVGTELSFFNRIGLEVNYAHAVIDNQMLPVDLPLASGFSSQWQNVGEITNKTLEGVLTVPIITRRDLNWTTRFLYDRTRSQITRLDVPEMIVRITAANTYDLFKYREGEMIGTVYGTDYVRTCSQLPAAFAGQCSMNAGDVSKAYRPNGDGFIVWLGEGNLGTEGITKNLWRARTGLGNGPWGNNTNWGMPISLRDSTGNVAYLALGSGLPKYHWSMSHNVEYKRFSAFGLLDAYMGQKLWNIAYHWSLGDFQSGEVDQAGKSVEDARPIGYYWRRGPSLSPGGNNAGVGGLYDVLGPTSATFEDASYAKIREVQVNYRVGAVGGMGDWRVGVIGRNLYTFTSFRGWDPEAGNSTGALNSSALTPVAGYRFPNLRTFTLQLSSTF